MIKIQGFFFLFTSENQSAGSIKVLVFAGVRRTDKALAYLIVLLDHSAIIPEEF